MLFRSRELLGADLAAERARQKGERDAYDRKLGWLPESKRSELREIDEEVGDQERLIREKIWDEGASLNADDRAMRPFFRITAPQSGPNNPS